MATHEDVLAFWFGDEAWSKTELWYERGRDLDPEIRTKFGALIEAMIAGENAAWEKSPEGRLAAIVVLDQWTRHAYRDTPKFVAGDARAERIAVAALDAEDWRTLREDQVSFLLSPLQHSEVLALHERALEALAQMIPVHPSVEGMREYLDDHREIIAQFGRFPDRNKLLGRPSSEEEKAFLATTHKGWFERQDF